MSAIISLTTIPDRIGKIGPCVESLLAQGLPVHVWAVEKIKRADTRLREIPPWLSASGAIVQVVEDRGPITKLLPALERGFDVILTADDDCIYGEGWASGLLAWAEKLPDAALAYRGRKLRDGTYSGSALVQHVKATTRVEILTGVYGALYRREAFGRGIFELWRSWPTNDDLVVAAHLQRRDVPRYVVPRRCTIRQYGLHRTTALFAVNRKGGDKRNDEGVKRLGLERGK